MYQKGNEESKLFAAYSEFRDDREKIRNIGEQFPLIKRLWEAIEEYYERPEVIDWQYNVKERVV